MTTFSRQPPSPRKFRIYPVYPAIIGAGALVIFMGCKSNDANSENVPLPVPQGSAAMPLVSAEPSASASGNVLADVPKDGGVSDAGVADGSVRDAGRKPIPRIPHPAGGMPGPLVPGPVK